MASTSEQIKAARKRAGLSVDQAALECGVSESTFRKWEGPNCGRYPKPYSLAGLIVLMAAKTDKSLARILDKHSATIAKIENRCPSCNEELADPEAPECPHCGQRSF